MHATAPGYQVQGNQEAGHTLTLDAITHRFGMAKAVDDVTLEIGGSELVALLGPSVVARPRCCASSPASLIRVRAASLSAAPPSTICRQTGARLA